MAYESNEDGGGCKEPSSPLATIPFPRCPCNSWPPPFPPGVRFTPTDEELIVHYLIPKVRRQELPYDDLWIEDDLYKYHPNELTDIYAAKGREGNWHVFTSRSRKYPNGARPDRSAGPGYWKATGSDQDILNAYGEVIGCKKALTYLVGKQPAGEKTGWLMQEYRINESPRPVDTANMAMLWDDYVLFRIYCQDIPKDSNGKQNNPTELFS